MEDFSCVNEEADEGDILIAEFDLAGGVALLRLRDDEILEEMSPEM
jgi:hypothetical protein